MNIQEIRTKYPQYADLPDDQLAQGLHKKFYSDMPYEEFSSKIGLKPVTITQDEYTQQLAGKTNTALLDNYPARTPESDLPLQESQWLKTVADMPEAKRATLYGLTKATDVFGAVSKLSEMGLMQKDFAPLKSALERWYSEIDSNPNNELRPSSVAGFAGDVGKMGTEFAVLPGSAPVKFALQTALQMPKPGETLLDRAGATVKSAAMGKGLSIAGRLIPQAATRIPLLSGAFAGLAAYEGGDKMDMAKAALTVPVFEAVGLLGQGKPFAAIRTARAIPVFKNATDGQIINELKVVAEAQPQEATQKPVESTNVPEAVNVQPEPVRAEAANVATEIVPTTASESKKEPWQMTKKEWAGIFKAKALSEDDVHSLVRERLSGNEYQMYLEDRVAAQSPDKPNPEAAGRAFDTEWKILKEEYGYEFNKKTNQWERVSNQAKQLIDNGLTHKQIVEQSLSSGKPVPRKVLADYPDLTPTTVQQAPALTMPSESATMPAMTQEQGAGRTTPPEQKAPRPEEKQKNPDIEKRISVLSNRPNSGISSPDVINNRAGTNIGVSASYDRNITNAQRASQEQKIQELLSKRDWYPEYSTTTRREIATLWLEHEAKFKGKDSWKTNRLIAIKNLESVKREITGKQKNKYPEIDTIAATSEQRSPNGQLYTDIYGEEWLEYSPKERQTIYSADMADFESTSRENWQSQKNEAKDWPGTLNELNKTDGKPIDKLDFSEMLQNEKENAISELNDYIEKTARELGLTVYPARQNKNSRYLKIKTPNEELYTIRVSDHHARSGSGFNQGTGETYSEPDINFVIDSGDAEVMNFVKEEVKTKLSSFNQSAPTDGGTPAVAVPETGAADNKSAPDMPEAEKAPAPVAAEQATVKNKTEPDLAKINPNARKLIQELQGYGAIQNINVDPVTGKLKSIFLTQDAAIKTGRVMDESDAANRPSLLMSSGKNGIKFPDISPPPLAPSPPRSGFRPGFVRVAPGLEKTDYGKSPQGINYDTIDPIRDTPAEKAGKAAEAVAKGASYVTRPISARLEDISPKIYKEVREAEFNKQQAKTQAREYAQPLERAYNKLPRRTREIFKLAALNGDIQTVERIAEKFGFANEVSQYRTKVADKIYQDQTDVGIDMGYLENRFPRVLVDIKGFDKYMNTDNSPIATAIKNKEEKLGRPLLADERNALVNSLMRGYKIGNIRLTPGAAKERTVPVITPEMSKFYAELPRAIERDIDQAYESIENRRLLGKEPEEIRNMRKQLSTLLTQQANSRSQDKRKLLEYQIVKLESKLDEIANKNLDESIGAKVNEALANGEMSPENATEVKQILNDFLSERKAPKWMSEAHSAVTSDIMNSVGSTIVSSPDIAITMAEHPINFAKAVLKAAAKRGWDINLKDLGITEIGKEYEKNAFGKVRDFQFLLNGFKPVDFFNKLSRANTYYQTYRTWAKQNNPKLERELGRYIQSPEELQGIKGDLKDGVISPRVKKVVWNRLADLYPISSAEMSRLYLTSPWSRVTVLALKSYFMKTFDYVRRESIKKMKDPQTRAEGIRNLILLPTVIIAANAGTDAARNWLYGKKVDLSESAINNLVQFISAGMISRYTMDNFVKRGARDIPASFVPAVSVVDDIVKAVIKGDTEVFVKHIPVIGRVVYSQQKEQSGGSGGRGTRGSRGGRTSR